MTKHLLLFLMVFFLNAVCLYGAEDLSESNENVFVIDLSDDGHMVDQVQADFIIRSLEKAEAENAKAVILVIDTFGGLVFSAREMTEKLLRMKIPTIAYVETKAISAGTFIAWACDRIVMQSYTTMGDAQMIFQTMDGMEEAPEKAISVFRSDWKKSSEIKGRSFALAQGFFDAKIQVIQVERDEDRFFMLQEDYDALDQVIKEATKIIKVVCKKDQLLTLYAEEAQEIGLVEVSDNLDSFVKSLGENIQTTQVEMTDNESLLRFLGANSWIFFVLTLIGLNAIYAEVKAPGFGIPGFTALVCFTLIFGTRFLLGTANEIEIAIFILGILLCLIEIFVIPGLGIIGIAGILCLFGSLVFASLPDFGWPESELEMGLFHESAQLMVVCFILSFVTFFMIFPTLLNLPQMQKRLLDKEFKVEDGYVVNSVGPAEDLIGQVAVVEGVLKPLGKIRLSDGRLFDATAQSGYFDSGVTVKIIKVDGNRIIVSSEDDGELS